MKKLSYLLFATSLLAACAAPTPKTTDDDIIEEEDGFDDIELVFEDTEPRTLMGLLENREGMRSTAEAASLAGLSDLLNGDDPYTVFVPSDEAWQEFLAGNISFLDNAEVVRQALSYHVVSTKLTSARIGERVTALELNQPTLAGPNLTIKYSDGDLTVNGASVIQKDVIATNGVIHVIDRVLTPQ